MKTTGTGGCNCSNVCYECVCIHVCQLGASLWQSASEVLSQETSNFHQEYQKSNTTLRWCKALLIFNWKGEQKIHNPYPPKSSTPNHHPFPCTYNGFVAFPNTITSPLWGHWSIVSLCMSKILVSEKYEIGRWKDKRVSKKKWVAEYKQKMLSLWSVQQMWFHCLRYHSLNPCSVEMSECIK